MIFHADTASNQTMRKCLGSDFAMLCGLGFFKLLLHFFSNQQYGYFTDEFYYMAAGDHLEWGFAEGTPLTPAIASLSRWMLGDSLFSIRLFPAIAGAFTVILTGLIARELGGGRLAQALSTIAAIFAPGYLFLHTVLTMNAFEPLLWTTCAYLVIRIIRTGQVSLWVVAGIVAGIGLMNKFSIAFFIASLVTGIFFTPARKILFNRWIILAAILAIIMFTPAILWQIDHGWPFLEHQRESNLYEKKGFTESTFDLLAQQFIWTNPGSVPLWLCGLYYYLGSPAGKPYRALGWSYLIVVGCFILFKGRFYYLFPIYPILFAAGAVFLEPELQRPAWKYASFALLIGSGLVFLPVGLPVLPVETLIRYSNAVYQPPSLSRFNVYDPTQAPWHYRIMLGWDEAVEQIAQAYQKLSPQDRAEAGILAWSYDYAGAVDLLGAPYHLPKAISGHTGYYFWGTRDYSGKVMLSLGGDLNFLRQTFNSVERVAVVKHEKSVGNKSELPIYLCKDIKRPLQEVWPAFKYYFKLPSENFITGKEQM